MDVVQEFRKHARTLVREFGFFKSQYEDTGATYGETHALIELKRYGRVEVSELARALNIEKSGASKMLTQMRKKGWVAYIKGDDGRKKLFGLTSAGKKTTAEVERYAERKMKLGFAELPASQHKAVVSALRSVTEALRTSRARAEYNVRVCEPKDNAQIAAIVRRALKDLGFAGPGTAAADPSLDYLSSFNTDRGCYLVAEKDGKVVGGAGIVGMPGERRTVCELVRMFTAPDARGSGLGQLLMDEALSRARAMGYKLCYLETTGRMKAAQALYLKNGFRYVKQRRGNTGHFACKVLMERKL